MTSYRFCRPDNIPLIVRALNECYDVYFPEDPPMDVERFRDEMRTLDVWPSSCMLALGSHEPVAVMVGTRRDDEVHVHRIGVRPGHEREGHGSHMLDSLSQKLAVLGPERIVTEVPAAIHGLDLFFESCGWEYEETLVDYWHAGLIGELAPEELVMPVTLADLLDAEALEVPKGVAWERQLKTLENLTDELEGFAVASPERIEASLLYRETEDGEAEILSLGCADPDRRETFFQLLIRHLASAVSQPLSLPRISEAELPAEIAGRLGFEPGERYARYATVAEPG